jgi:predicted CxxxxCH...CXXCH cytochrome family protein
MPCHPDRVRRNYDTPPEWSSGRWDNPIGRCGLCHETGHLRFWFVGHPIVGACAVCLVRAGILPAV